MTTKMKLLLLSSILGNTFLFYIGYNLIFTPKFLNISDRFTKYGLMFFVIMTILSCAKNDLKDLNDEMKKEIQKLEEEAYGSDF